jgi:hypothetical protein
MRHLFVLAALLWSTAIAFAADPVGMYSVEGNKSGRWLQVHRFRYG